MSKHRVMSALAAAAVVCGVAGLGFAASYGKLSGTGSGSSSVTTDPSLTGVGTPGSPLGVNPVSTLAPDFRGKCVNTFLQKSGLTPGQITVHDEQDFTWFGLGVGSGGAGAVTNSVGGATVAFSATIGGGVVVLTGGTSGTSYADWDRGGPSGFRTEYLPIKSRRWIQCYRVGTGTTPGANTNFGFGIYLAGVAPYFIGIGAHGAQSVFNLVYGTANTTGAALTNVLATDVAIVVDATGATYKTMYVANFDLVHLTINPDVEAGHADIQADLISNLATDSVASGYIFNEGTSGSNGDKLFLDAEVGVGQNGP